MADMTDIQKKAFAARLHEALDDMHLPVRGRGVLLARWFDVSTKATGNWLNGESMPATTKIPELAAKMKVSSEWLLSGNGSKSGDNLSRLPDEKSAQLTDLDKNTSKVTEKRFPVLSWVQAGLWTGVQSVQAMDVTEWFPPLSEDDPDECYYLKVRGISNSPTYLEGDYVLVDPCIYVSDLVSGDLIVVANGDGETFKKLIIESNERKYLQALNPDWKPNIIEFTEDTRLLGLVIDGFRPIGGSRRKRTRR